jgi:hypothetical protein
LLRAGPVLVAGHDQRGRGDGLHPVDKVDLVRTTARRGVSTAVDDPAANGADSRRSLALRPSSPIEVAAVLLAQTLKRRSPESAEFLHEGATN